MEWSRTTEVYRIRAAFTLASSAAIHNDKITDEKINEYLELIRECSNNLHEHVKKAGNKTQMWIAKDVLREIENVVKAAGRKRLISANTKMGQEV